MKLKKFKRFLAIATLALLSYQDAFSQCFQIESILVDACGVQEGLNEMVRFKVGNADINTSNLTVSWPNNPWQGLIRNATTASKVATLNADILDAGGCGQLIEPTGGVLPANANVILVTSHTFDTDLNSFGALTDNIYIIFQNNPSTASGHFANSGTGIRTLTISFGSCSDTVSYDRALLIDTNGATVAADGAIVQYNPAGTPTYINNGCSAPVQPFTVNAGPATLTACAGTTISLNGIAQGHQSVRWSAPSGNFSTPNNLATTYTSSASQAGNVVTITLTAINSCGLEITDTINLTLTNSVTPNFPTTLSLCRGNTAPVLNTTSPNGITGTWNPAVINNTANGSYVFTPNNGQCAAGVTLNVTVTNSITPNFPTTLSLCTGNTAPTLNTTSPNGITGTWNPAVINNTANGSYVFTPNPGQCATNVTLNVTVSNSITPNFPTTLSLCSGSTAPLLNTTSPNGITGTWNPTVISNTANGSYVFTPNAGQCATSITLNVTVSNSITPNFPTTLSLCNGSTAPLLNTTSPNGITGTWSPTVISNTANGSYVFTPNAGQCATSVTLNVTVSNSITPNFPTTLSLCSGGTVPTLNTTSPNGITGTWSPAVISNTANGSYVFTPNAGQCATSVTLNVTVSNSITPNFPTTLSLCTGNTAPTLNTTSPNGITGMWNPAVINNTTSGSYVFTPNAGQCAASVTLIVTVASSITPNFPTSLTVCTGSTAPILNTTSPNGITGTWNPAVVSNTASGSYVFTPNAGQCATSLTLNVTVTNSITPNFATTLSLCSGSTAPILNATSPNGITGTWNPAVISTTAGGSYVFTPNAGQCAISMTLNVTITNSIIPDFATALALCNGDAAPTLNTTSPNGVTGTWNPAVISNTTSGSYVFTPNAGQCAPSITLSVTVGNVNFEINNECQDGDYVITVVTVAGSFDSNEADYQWTNSQGGIVGTDSYLNITDLLNATPVEEEFPITYYVRVTTPQGCTLTQERIVYGTFCSIPKGISPNNDSRNDEFDLSGLGVKELTIFNRYGVKVYGYKNYTNQWKGQSDQGNELPDATYYYVISKSDGQTLTGWVYINR
ncbi:gliding motility-associated-like protein [Flavobacterium gossypii]|uniref:Gliding motility-associated-like protein n=1 Tax=Flavobacterium gossypii TaxID=1646119 RepID=A0ABR6DRR5_9FLAO|nr:gliding motility-associated C-terminal domain-containing protein [Flavobacterium gossypii]MBA9074377.1 gliding motility-associated-like protein [Flavobacterium gossypii]